MKPLIVPTVNLNGNTAESLLEQLKELMTTLTAVEMAFANASDVVHGRNFQTLPKSGDVHYEAVQAWQERRTAIANINDELVQLARAIHSQKRER